MNKKIGLGIVGILILVGTFFGGMVYGKSQVPTRGQGMSDFGPNGAMRGARNSATVGGFITGQVISKDAKSITIKLQDGGSKIIFLGTSTTIAKMAVGSMNDLTIGMSVSITGTPNTDGSVTAQSVQIRPNVPAVVR